MPARGPLGMCGMCHRRVATQRVRHWLRGHTELISITEHRCSDIPTRRGPLWGPYTGASGSTEGALCSSCVVDVVAIVADFDNGPGLEEPW